MSDDEIVKLYADKDEKAIAATKEKYHNYLYKISFQVLGGILYQKWSFFYEKCRKSPTFISKIIIDNSVLMC